MPYDSQAGTSRYAFVSLLAATLVAAMIAVCVVNVQRSRSGREPFISRYLAPPSYQQSQPPLPMYTEQPNPQQDAGYYDPQGNFVATKAQLAESEHLQSPPPVHPRDRSWDAPPSDEPIIVVQSPHTAVHSAHTV